MSEVTAEIETTNTPAVIALEYVFRLSPPASEDPCAAFAAGYMHGNDVGVLTALKPGEAVKWQTTAEFMPTLHRLAERIGVTLVETERGVERVNLEAMRTTPAPEVRIELRAVLAEAPVQPEAVVVAPAAPADPTWVLLHGEGRHVVVTPDGRRWRYAEGAWRDDGKAVCGEPARAEEDRG